MRRQNLFFSLMLLFIFLISCKGDDQEKENITTEPIAFTKEGELTLMKPSGDTIQQLDIEIADNEYERETGLMYRESMETEQGMLFIYDKAEPRYFWMKNTYIPLDIIYFGSDSTAVSLQENAQPRDETALPSNEPAQFILEINGGLAEQWGLEAGDKMTFKRTE